MLQQTGNDVLPAVMTTRVSALYNAFRRIEMERMQDVPLLNPALTVATVGFQEWNNYYLGVLTTPWMMKLIGLPTKMQSLVQAEVIWQFPSGEYALAHDMLPEVGSYYSVSLFSPMDEFHDQVQAEATAAAVMEALFEESSRQNVTKSVSSDTRLERNMTRRELLLGMFRDKKPG